MPEAIGCSREVVEEDLLLVDRALADQPFTHVDAAFPIAA